MRRRVSAAKGKEKEEGKKKSMRERDLAHRRTHCSRTRSLLRVHHFLGFRVLVDVQKCISACKQSFSGQRKKEYEV